jgi:hypothetical protein
MEGQARVNAFLDPDLKKRLYRVLLEEDLTFSDWLRRQIDAYLAEKEPKGKRRKGKGDRP